MAAGGGEESQGGFERQRARLLQPRQSWETGPKASRAESEDGERRWEAKVFLRQDVWDEEQAD